MRKRIETIEESVSIQDTAKKMRDRNVSSLVVVDVGGRPVGLITERDIVRKLCVKDFRTSKVANSQIMSSPLITIDYRSTASDATDLMLKNNVRHLLVVDEKTDNASKPIGMITPLDFTKVEEYTGHTEKKDNFEMILEYYI